MYRVHRTPRQLTIDGNLDKPEWQVAAKSPRFVDMGDGRPAWYDTRAAILWDDEALYMGSGCKTPIPVRG